MRFVFTVPLLLALVLFFGNWADLLFQLNLRTFGKGVDWDAFHWHRANQPTRADYVTFWVALLSVTGILLHPSVAKKLFR